MNMNKHRIEIYDTTLRDGTQGELVSFSVSEKLQVASLLDELQVDYIEGGWPGANPRDSEFFQHARGITLRHAQLAAFGSTAHPSNPPDKDPNLRALLDAETPVVTIFGKSWTLHVEQALGISLDENLHLVERSVAFLSGAGRQVVFDAEHFFDGFAADPQYALSVLRAAANGGASRLVLCDTNGGSLPAHIENGVGQAREVSHLPLGIHAHDDCDLGTANALAAVQAGATHVQGTFNGWGERCGNANLCSIIPVLELKMGYQTIGLECMSSLTGVAQRIAELANLPLNQRLPFVGRSAFAHKGGIHVSAVRRNPATYEHIDPALVGNVRRVLVSDLAGKSNLLEKAVELGLARELDPTVAQRLTARIKQLESHGYELESADGSLELMFRRELSLLDHYFTPVAFTVQSRYIGQPATLAGAAKNGTGDERASLLHGEGHSEAQVTLNVQGETVVSTASDLGPVAALDVALRKALSPRYPEVANIILTDYKVRILEGNRGTKAQVRVLVESSDGHNSWTTVGVSDNVIEASWEALTEAQQYCILRHRVSGAWNRAGA